MIDADAIIGSLDRIEAHLRRLGRRVPQLLQSGLSVEAISAAQRDLPFAPTRELIVLYQWRDGTLALPGDVLDELNFLPGFYFLSLEEAIQTFHERRDAPQWRPGWFPFLADGAGDFYIVKCEPDVIDASAVIGFLHGEPEQVEEYTCIASMLKTLDAAYDEGAFYLDEDDTLEIDDDHYREIAHRFNPEIEEWQD
jgi:hypothetical protein